MRPSSGTSEAWPVWKSNGAPFFLHEVNPNNPAEDSPDRLGVTSTRIELFVDDADSFRERAIAAGASPGSEVEDHQYSWERIARPIAWLGYQPSPATIWSIAGDLDVLLTAWRVRLKPGSTSSAPVFPVLITMQPHDCTALDQTVIDEAVLADAHTLAAELLRDAGR